MKRVLYLILAGILATTTVSCYDSEEVLKEAIAETKSEIPEEIDEGLIVTDITLSAKYATYLVEVDEDLYDISLLKENISELKHEIKEELFGDEDVVFFANLLKETHRGLAYKYIGTTTGETCVVTFEEWEL